MISFQSLAPQAIDVPMVTTVAKVGSSRPSGKEIVEIEFSMGDIVWGKIKGFYNWPAKIVGFSEEKVTIRWFNDYRYSSVFKSQICKFEEHCITFSKKAKSSPALETAIKEALIDFKLQKS